MKNIILIAPPGAGKGTLSSILVEKYGYVHISTGDILRDMAQKNDALGQKISSLLAKGELIPDEIIYECLMKRLQLPDLDRGYILDGFPRNIDQAINYDKILQEINRDLGVVIYLNTDKETLCKRITGRRICPSCKSTYNVLTGVNAPLKDNICDKCGSSLEQRSDDNIESFNNRYQTFIDKTYPLVNYYQNKNVLYSIDSKEPNDTMKKIEAIIND